MNTAEQQRVVDEIKSSRRAVAQRGLVARGRIPIDQTARLPSPRRARRDEDTVRDLARQAATFAYEMGATFAEASRRFDVSTSVVDRYFGRMYPGVSKAGRFRK